MIKWGLHEIIMKSIGEIEEDLADKTEPILGFKTSSKIKRADRDSYQHNLRSYCIVRIEPFWRNLTLWVILKLVSGLYAKSRFGRGARIDDIIEKLSKKITEKDRKIVIKSDRGNPPVAIIENSE